MQFLAVAGEPTLAVTASGSPPSLLPAMSTRKSLLFSMNRSTSAALDVYNGDADPHELDEMRAPAECGAEKRLV